MAKRSLFRALRQKARGMWDAVASSVGGLIGGYQVLDPRRKILPRGLLLRSMSANELSNMSLVQLRALCRKLERDNSTARAAVEGIVANVVGTGIALEPDTGDKDVDKKIGDVWREYIAGCDITGKRSIYSLQSEACREDVIAGEHLWRLIVLPERAALGLIPLVVLPLECEWLDEAPPVQQEGITSVNGIELDRWGRPVAYNLQNPEMGLTDKAERVDAKEIIHSFERRRALQGRGEPWLVPVIERIWQEGDLVDAELKSAVNCAAMALVITSKSHDGLDTDEEGTTDDPAQRVGVGAVARLYPDEDIKAFSHNRPSQQIAQFRRSLRGDIAASSRIDQRWLDRDYSQTNFSGQRFAANDDEKLLTPVREWFGNDTIGTLYLRALPWLALKAGVPLPKSRKYKLIPDGQAYINPYEDIQASCMAIASGLSTHEKEIGKRGEDYRDVWKQAAKEREELKAMGVTFDLSGTNAPAPESQDGAEPPADPAAAQKKQAEADTLQAQKTAALLMLSRSAERLAETIEPTG
jgi:lambda family phage portal protein